MKYIIFIASCFLYLNANSQIRINEVMSKNSSVLEDEFGETPDWIELVNTCDCSVNLAGWALTDDYDESELEFDDWWFFPDTTLLPNQLVLVLASGLEFPNNTQHLHADFKLKQGGEELALFDSNQNLQDFWQFLCIPEDKSFGRLSEDSLTHFLIASPGESNISSVAYNQINNDIVLSTPSGFYADPVELSVYSSNNSPIKFSYDGSIPNENSPILDDLITISEHYVFENSLSLIPTAYNWDEPQTDVFKGDTYKFITYDYGCPSSELMTADYFVHPNHEELFPFPVVSITVEKEDFFGDNGIYVPGITGENYFQSGDDWEMPAHFGFFNSEKELEISQPINVRTRGRGSRANRQKSLKLYARNDFGKDWFNYKFFNGNDLDAFRKIVIRSGHSDFTNGMIKDLVATELVRNLNVDFMDSEPVTVFINGEYWGVQFLRENLSQDYVAAHYDLNPDSIDIIKNNTELTDGSFDDYGALLDYMHSVSEASPLNYNQVAEFMDIENFIDYNISQIYLANWDWPFNNVKAWKHQSDEAKFRWMFFDCDACMFKTSYENFSEFDQPDETSVHYETLQKLLSNNQFRQEFRNRFFELIQTEFNPEKVIGIIDSLEHMLEPAMGQHILRWSMPSSVQEWKSSLDEMRGFALQRPIIMLDVLDKHFSAPLVTIYPNPCQGDMLYTSAPFGDVDRNYEVLDLQGKKMKTGTINSTGEIDVSALSDGMYLLKVYFDQIVTTQRFQKL